MQPFKIVKNSCVEIRSYVFNTKDASTYNAFLNTLGAIDNLVVSRITLENSKDEIDDKRNVQDLPLVFPFTNIGEEINKYGADVMHISVEYNSKPIELIVTLSRFVVSICMAKEDGGMLEMFGSLLMFAMRYTDKHGWWIKLTPHSEAVCSVCMKAPKHIFGELFSYCPHCGSKNQKKG